MSRKASQWVLTAVVLTAGCESQDAERLSRIGRLLTEKVQASFVMAQSQLDPGWHTGFDELGLDSRISARLRWDKLLADATIGVRVTNGQVELTGRVADLARRRRAMDLAESTVGVESVVDRLESP
jgi:hypothetical protein